MKLETITIDDTPENVAEMLARGFFHSHQNGKWRWSPFQGDTVYCNDPTVKFEYHAEFSHGRAASLHPPCGLVAKIYSDGTRRMRKWDRDAELTLRSLYAPQDNGERDQRQWILDTMGAHS